MHTLRNPKVWPFLVSIGAAIILNIAFFKVSFILAILGLFALFPLQYAASRRLAFYSGLLCGFLVYSFQLQFFFTIFSYGAAALWIILSLWYALFCLIAREFRHKYSPIIGSLLIATAWAALELFRSELYYLRFSWLGIGQTAILDGFGIAPFLGEFGVSLIIALGVAIDWSRFNKPGFIGTFAVILIGLLPAPTFKENVSKMTVTGIQMEFPTIDQATNNLTIALAKHPNTDLFVLSEYSFTGPVPKPIFDWCKAAKKHLILGAHDTVGDNYYNTAFVINPDGKVVFKQAKSVPIQFFKDGLPATGQDVWQSPWGKIGLGVCYDLSYRKVVDQLIRKGAQVLIFPTMDLQEWGEYQHELNARIGLLRARTYQVPVVRICSSGISQIIPADGEPLLAQGSFPGQNEIISASITPSDKGKLPLDMPVGLCGLVIMAGALVKRAGKKDEKVSEVPAPVAMEIQDV